MAQAITSIAEIKINGRYYRTKNDAVLRIGGFDSTQVVGDRVHGFAEKPMGSRLEITLVHSDEISLGEVAAFKNAVITIELNTGQTYVMGGATIEENPSLSINDEGSEISAVFNGDILIEQ